jgi:hypothetical protein
LPSLSDERGFTIVQAPAEKPADRRITLPPFKVQPVEGPDAQLWADLDWPDDVNSIASSALMEEGKLVIYYSKVFQKYADQLAAFEKRDIVLATSFTKRYEIWLVVHSFLLYRDQQEAESSTIGIPSAVDSDLAELRERQERCRLANIASMVAAREVQTAQQSIETE